MATWYERVEDRLADIRAAGRWRQPRDLDTDGPVTGTLRGTGGADGPDGPGLQGPTAPCGPRVVTFAANDYLGLSRHPAVVAAAHEALDRWGAGSGAARLVVGSRPVHSELEAALADWKGCDDAVLFPTGFAANLGVLAALGSVGGPGVTVLSDELNHASIIDGCRLSRARVRVYRHADLDHLAALLAEVGTGPVVVVTDTVFSMDGDTVDLPRLVDLVAGHGAALVLDEAHAALGPDLPRPAGRNAGLTGPGPGPGSGTGRASTVRDGTVRDGTSGAAGAAAGGGVVLRVGTLSKTLGSLGGFVAGPRPFVDLLRNVSRPFIFTTAATPADSAAALAALRIMRSAEGEALVARLRGHVDRLCPGHPSQILPVVLGDEDAALDAAAGLAERGLLVPAIRPPTVPPGTSRLRIALSAAHDDDQIGRLITALAEVAPDALAALRTGTSPAVEPGTSRTGGSSGLRQPTASSDGLDGAAGPSGAAGDGGGAAGAAGAHEPAGAAAASGRSGRRLRR